MSEKVVPLRLRAIRRGAGVPMSVWDAIIHHADDGKRIFTGTILTWGWRYAKVSSWNEFTIPVNRRTRSAQC